MISTVHNQTARPRGMGCALECPSQRRISEADILDPTANAYTLWRRRRRSAIARLVTSASGATTSHPCGTPG